jgi:hypothetical protein
MLGSASSSVSFRKVTLPIFLTSAMGVFEAWQRVMGEGVESHSRYPLSSNRLMALQRPELAALTPARACA